METYITFLKLSENDLPPLVSSSISILLTVIFSFPPQKNNNLYALYSLVIFPFHSEYFLQLASSFCFHYVSVSFEM